MFYKAIFNTKFQNTTQKKFIWSDYLWENVLKVGLRVSINSFFLNIEGMISFTSYNMTIRKKNGHEFSLIMVMSALKFVELVNGPFDQYIVVYNKGGLLINKL